MYWKDPYADKYQKANGFKATIETIKGKITAWISMKPTTRAAYDLSMRENTIDGIITMDDLSLLKPGYMYTLDEDKKSRYFIQTLSKWETQEKTLNFNAIRCNCKVTILRKEFQDWVEVYKDIDASVSTTLTDSKNFNAGFEDATYYVIQLPIIGFKTDEENNKVEFLREIKANDKAIIQSDFNEKLIYEVAVESVNNIGISGTVKLQGTQEMRR